MKKEMSFERYQRQMLLKEFGREAQEKLFRSKVLIIGAGGLGCPALLYLASAGVGELGIVDHDVVEETNLNRQVLYNRNDVGKPKAKMASERISEKNPDILINAIDILLTNQNAIELISQYDIVIDGSDNFDTRYLVNDACVLLEKPLVYGSVMRFEGQLAVFNVESSGVIKNYRDLFPVPPDPGQSPSCNEIGVLGILPGLIGTMQSWEAIKLITGIGEPLINRLMVYNALTNSFSDFSISSVNEIQEVPKSIDDFKKYDYRRFCNSKDVAPEVSVMEFNRIINDGSASVIDVRERNEFPETYDFPVCQIPLSEFEESEFFFPEKSTIVFLCQSGRRSRQAQYFLKGKKPQLLTYSLRGGIESLKLSAQK